MKNNRFTIICMKPDFAEFHRYYCNVIRITLSRGIRKPANHVPHSKTAACNRCAKSGICYSYSTLKRVSPFDGAGIFFTFPLSPFIADSKSSNAIFPSFSASNAPARSRTILYKNPLPQIRNSYAGGISPCAGKLINSLLYTVRTVVFADEPKQ